MRVLVADDNEMYGAMLSRFVASHPGMDVVGRARSGCEAIAMASTLEPDMVLMDLCMPDIDGISATRAVRAMQRPAAVILLTAHRVPGSEEDCLNAGASGFLCKSDADSRLIDLIRSLGEAISKADGPCAPGESPEARPD
jgi:DNA-binding NarL/FixJ family response regulator